MIIVNTGYESIKLDTEPKHVTIENTRLVVRDNTGNTIGQFRKWENWHLHKEG